MKWSKMSHIVEEGSSHHKCLQISSNKSTAVNSQEEQIFKHWETLSCYSRLVLRWKWQLLNLHICSPLVLRVWKGTTFVKLWQHLGNGKYMLITATDPLPSDRWTNLPAEMFCSSCAKPNQTQPQTWQQQREQHSHFTAEHPWETIN